MSVRAGKAFLAAAEANGDNLESVRQTLHTVFEAHRSDLEAALEARRHAGDELVSRGFPSPEDIEDLERIARTAGVAREDIGSLTFRDIYIEALAWFDRRLIEKSMDCALGLDGRTSDELAELPDLVRLDQAAAAAHTSKRTLERCKTEGTLPDPIREGGGGKPALYDWKIMRPWLTENFGIILPEKFPANIR